jgi:hypothetical protein
MARAIPPAPLPEARSRREQRFVLGWRYERLVRAGYAERDAMVVAERTDVDLHLAVELVERGCSTETALRILL